MALTPEQLKAVKKGVNFKAVNTNSSMNQLAEWMNVADNAPTLQNEMSKPEQQSKIINNINKFGNFWGELGKGFGAGVTSTFSGMSGLGEKLLLDPMKKLAGQETQEETTAERLIPEKYRTAPESTAGKIGFYGEQIGEFLIPIGTQKFASMLDDAIRILPKYLAKGAVEGAEFAGKTALQTGGDLKETGQAGAIGLAVPPTLAAGKRLLEPMGQIVAGVMSQMIGKRPEHILQSFRNSTEVSKAMSQKVVPLEVRDQAVSALKAFEKNFKKTFNKGLEDVKKLSPILKQARTEKGVFSGVKSEFKNLLNKGEDSLQRVFRQFSVAVENKGKTLNFDKLNSSIISPTEKKQIQMAWDTIRNQTKFDATNVQRVASRLKKLQNFAEGVQTETSALINSMYNKYITAVGEVYPKLGALRGEYKAAKDIHKGLDSILNSYKNERVDPTKVTSAVKKLSNLFNEDNEAYLKAIKRLENVSGVDLLNQLAASEFANIAPGSFGSRIAQAGMLAGAWFSPLTLLTLPLFSPRFVGRAVTTAGKASKVIGATEPLISPTIIESLKEKE